MPIGYLKPMLKVAKAGRYGIAAFNMIDYNSARAIIMGAQELEAPIIVQLSTKTIRLWGARAIATWVHGLAADVDSPVALHLDHCTDVEIIKRCIDAGWTSVMFDGSALPFAENVRQSRAVYDLTQAAGIGLEAELGGFFGRLLCGGLQQRQRRGGGRSGVVGSSSSGIGDDDADRRGGLFFF